MTKREDGSDRIAFAESLCVRLVPCHLMDNVLLEGWIGGSTTSRYQNVVNWKAFLSWEETIVSALKKMLLKNHRGVMCFQDDGSVWQRKEVFVSDAAFDWHSKGDRKFKQFKDSREFHPIDRHP